MFSTLRAGYNSLQASTQPQSATLTIDKLCDRLLNSQQREDRRAALLAIKGLSRDWKTEVGSQALQVLLGVLEDDAAEDTEMAKAVVETLSLLCEVEEVDGRPVRDDSGLRNSDAFLATPTPLHTLLTLLTPSHFYLRFFTLQLLGILLANRPQQVQQYVLTAAGGIGKLVETLSDSREIIRNESLLLLIALTTQNADIQKLMAFEGAFDKLFGIVRSEGGIGAGGIVVQDCLAAVAGLLRWNVSNQNYFRETTCIPMLAPLLLFPRPNALTPQSLATFAFQSWSEQKVINAGLVISVVRMLVGGAGGSGRSQNQEALLKTGLTRCLIEMALASNAPAILKAQSLNALADIMRSSPENQAMLTSLIITPLIPPAAPSSAESYNEENGTENGEQSRGSMDGGWSDPGAEPERAVSTRWQRGESVPAVVAVTNLAVNGDGTPGREGLRVRSAAANLFTSYVAGSTETQLGVLSTMLAPPPDAEHTMSSGSVILDALRTFPSSSRSDTFDSYVPFFACLLFSHLIVHSEVCKEVARKIYFQGDDTSPGGMGDEDERITLVGILVGNLMMAQREQAQSVNAGLGPERVLEWSRIMIGYLTSLCVWMWESPNTVKEFLSEGSNLQVLIQPITQSSGVDAVVQGLCTYLLGVCYEYNREPGPISRETLHPILQSRVGPDQFVSRILRLREDPRFRNVGPNVLELIDEDDALAEDLGEENGLWFDFSFVEFLKTNYISVQRSILVDPHASTAMAQSMSGISPDVLAALRASLAAQTAELDELRDTVRTLQQEREQERAAVETEFASMSDTILSLRQQLEAAQAAKADADREQEDLLVLLDDLNEKRSKDKRRMRAAQLEVSEDEDGSAGEDEENELSLDQEPRQPSEPVPPSLPVEGFSARELHDGDEQQQVHPACPEPPTPEGSAIPSPGEPGGAGNQQDEADGIDDEDPYWAQQSVAQPPPATDEAPPFELHDPYRPPQPDIPQTSRAADYADNDPYNPFQPEASHSVASQFDAASTLFDAASSLFGAPDAEKVDEPFAPTADYEPAKEPPSPLRHSAASEVPDEADVELSPAEQASEHALALDGAASVASLRGALSDDEPSQSEPAPRQEHEDALAASALASAQDVLERPTTPQSTPPPTIANSAPNLLRATPRRPPRDRSGRDLIEPHVVDEEDFRPKSAAGTAALPPPPPRASGPAPPPRSSAAPPPRSIAKSAPRRAFFAEPGMSTRMASPKQQPAMAAPSFVSDDTILRSASPHSEESPMQSRAATNNGSSSGLPEPSLFSPQAASHASPGSPTRESHPSDDLSELLEDKAKADVPPQEDSTATAASDPRRTSIDDRLATAFFGGNGAREDDSVSGLFSGPTKDVSALFGGAFQAASRTAGSLFGSTERDAPEPRAIVDSQRSEQRAREASATEKVPVAGGGGPAGPLEERSASSLFGGGAPTASGLFGDQQSERDAPLDARAQSESDVPAGANNARTAPQPPPSRTRPESQDVSMLFGGSAASLFGGRDDPVPDKPSRNGHNPFEAPLTSNPYESAHSFFASHQREPSKPTQSGVRDVSSLFG